MSAGVQGAPEKPSETYRETKSAVFNVIEPCPERPSPDTFLASSTQEARAWSVLLADAYSVWLNEEEPSFVMSRVRMGDQVVEQPGDHSRRDFRMIVQL